MRRWAGIVLAAALLSGTAACGGDDDPPAAEDQPATEFGDLKPEDVRASPAEVADGFRELNRYIDELLAQLGTDDAAASELQERLLTIWESILGTVKANDEDAYQKLDQALSLLMTLRTTDDRPRAQDAADTVSETAEDYLERFPGAGSAAPRTSGSPSPESDVESDTESDTADPPISY